MRWLQGLHEIAVVLLLQVGEDTAGQLLRRLVCTQLRDNTRAELDAVVETLQLIQPILASTDARLASHLRHAQLPPFFALSWFITWFAHNVPAASAPRLFDVFLAAHPLMPLYLYLAAVLQVWHARCLSLSPFLTPSSLPLVRARPSLSTAPTAAPQAHACPTAM